MGTEDFSTRKYFLQVQTVLYVILIVMRDIRAGGWGAHSADPGGAALCVRDQGPQPGQQGGVQRGGHQGHAPAGQGGRQESRWEDKRLMLKSRVSMNMYLKVFLLLIRPSQ